MSPKEKLSWRDDFMLGGWGSEVGMCGLLLKVLLGKHTVLVFPMRSSTL